MNRVALYYTHDAKPEWFTLRIYDRLREQTRRLGIRLVTVTRRGRPDADAEVAFAGEGKPELDMYGRIIAGLGACEKDDSVFFCEDDVLYADRRFAPIGEVDPDAIYYHLNFVLLTDRGFTENGYDREVLALSQARGRADYLLKCMKWKVQEIEEHRFDCFEPANGGPFPYKSFGITSPHSCIDIRFQNHTEKDLSDAVMFFQESGWPDSHEMSRLWVTEKP